MAVANVAEERLAHIPEGDDATRDGDRLLIFSRLISRARFEPSNRAIASAVVCVRFERGE